MKSSILSSINNYQEKRKEAKQRRERDKDRESDRNRERDGGGGGGHQPLSHGNPSFHPPSLTSHSTTVPGLGKPPRHILLVCGQLFCISFSFTPLSALWGALASAPERRFLRRDAGWYPTGILPGAGAQRVPFERGQLSRQASRDLIGHLMKIPTVLDLLVFPM